VSKHGLAVAIHVLIESDAGADLRQDHFKSGLAAFQRITPEIVGFSSIRSARAQETGPFGTQLAMDSGDGVNDSSNADGRINV
jgi:hypothetical protein